MSILDAEQSARYIDSLVASVQALEADLAATRDKLRKADDNARMWELTAQQMANDRECYQRIVREAGKHFGVAARTSDDGSVQDDVLALKVPELVAQAQARIAALERERDICKRQYERLNLCSDHRDKANGRCVCCQVESNTRAAQADARGREEER